MSVLGPGYVAQAQALRVGEDDRGYGWVLFAGLMLGMAGTVNFIEGIAAVNNSHFFATNPHYVFGDLKTWGWVVLILGVLQGLASVGIFVKNQLARWAGAAFATANAVAQLLNIPSYPLWALAIFAVDVLVVYGLVTYGGRTFRPA
jgi:hypothetical protein